MKEYWVKYTYHHIENRLDYGSEDIFIITQNIGEWGDNRKKLSSGYTFSIEDVKYLGEIK